MSFPLSIGLLGLVQAALVAAPGRPALPILDRLRGRWWALVLPGSIVVVIAAIAADPGSAGALTYLALGAIPLLAALALAMGIRGARPWLAALAVPLFLVACGPSGSLPVDAAALALSALACISLGCLFAAAVPPRWLELGIYAMAIVDVYLVTADLLQAPNATLNAAAPAAGLPQLQFAQLGSAQMGFGDLFVAAVLGAMLADRRSLQLKAAALTALLALLFDLLFFFVGELPATVPVALSLALLRVVHGRRSLAGEVTAKRSAPQLVSGRA
jgi:hypothetical protein